MPISSSSFGFATAKNAGATMRNTGPLKQKAGGAVMASRRLLTEPKN
jgi:hypothetical protein